MPIPSHDHAGNPIPKPSEWWREAEDEYMKLHEMLDRRQRMNNNYETPRENILDKPVRDLFNKGEPMTVRDLLWWLFAAFFGPGVLFILCGITAFAEAIFISPHAVSNRTFVVILMIAGVVVRLFLRVRVLP